MGRKEDMLEQLEKKQVTVSVTAPVVRIGEGTVMLNGNPKSTFTGSIERWGGTLIAIKEIKGGVRVPRLIRPEEILTMAAQDIERNLTGL